MSRYCCFLLLLVLRAMPLAAQYTIAVPYKGNVIYREIDVPARYTTPVSLSNHLQDQRVFNKPSIYYSPWYRLRPAVPTPEQLQKKVYCDSCHRLDPDHYEKFFNAFLKRDYAKALEHISYINPRYMEPDARKTYFQQMRQCLASFGYIYLCLQAEKKQAQLITENNAGCTEVEMADKFLENELIDTAYALYVKHGGMLNLDIKPVYFFNAAGFSLPEKRTDNKLAAAAVIDRNEPGNEFLESYIAYARLWKAVNSSANASDTVNNLQHALEMYTRLADMKNNARYYYTEIKAELEAALGRFDSAFADMENCHAWYLKNYYTSFQAYKLSLEKLVSLGLYAGKADRAIHYLYEYKSINKSPENPIDYTSPERAMIYIASGKYDSALTDLKALADRNKKVPAADSLNQVIKTLKGIALYEKGDYTAVIKTLTGLQPAEAKYYSILASYRKGDKAAACKLIEGIEGSKLAHYPASITLLHTSFRLYDMEDLNLGQVKAGCSK